MQFIGGVNTDKATSLRLRLEQAVGALFLFALPYHSFAAGVTVVTHGYNGNVTEWVIPMCDKMAQYRGLSATNVSRYTISITRNAQGVFVATAPYWNTVNPLLTSSGEIIIALDWSSLSGLGGAGTADIAAAAAGALLSTNLIPELNGRRLAEWPLHLAGHSRGGSVVTELARVLGAQGIWVDHVTTLDPHPVSFLGDPSMKNYANTLFTDNYWQDMGDNLFVPNGQAVTGAYNRYLTNLSGGYSSTHSDVHLWYHGTIDLATSASDTQATITGNERISWWTTPEARGTNTGFLYGLIGGGDRLSALEPAGAGNGRIRDGFNQVWDLGAGVSANRTALTVNNGLWPNFIRLNATGASQVPAGQAIPVSYYYQYGSNSSVTANARFYLDRDANPFNGTEIEVLQGALAGTGMGGVNFGSVSLVPNPAVVWPGGYRVLGRISDGTRTRWLYAPQVITISPGLQPPTLFAERVENSEFRFSVSGYPGQTVAIEGSTNLNAWVPLQTNVLGGAGLDVSDAAFGGVPMRFYRAVLRP